MGVLLLRRFADLSTEEQLAIAAYARAECARLYSQFTAYIAANMQSDSAAWQKRLCEHIAQDPGQVKVIMAALKKTHSVPNNDGGGK
jgi:hypothetical protein